MKIIAVAGVKGGVGTTTVAAHIAAALNGHDQSVLALDLSPQNMLRLYFGMDWTEPGGLAGSLLDGKSWYERCYKSDNGIFFIPFGEIEEDADEGIEGDGAAEEGFEVQYEGQYEEQVAGDDEDWVDITPEMISVLYRDNFDQLREQLSHLNFDEEGWLIVDCPYGSMGTDWRDSVIGSADLVIHVLTPDTSSYALLNKLSTKSGESNNSRALKKREVLLINRFSSAVELEQDIKSLLQTEYQGHLLPVTVHEDKSVGEALACKRTVFEYSPYCQANRDFDLISTWLLSKAHTGGLHNRTRKEVCE